MNNKENPSHFTESHWKRIMSDVYWFPSKHLLLFHLDIYQLITQKVEGSWRIEEDPEQMLIYHW